MLHYLTKRYPLYAHFIVDFEVEPYVSNVTCHPPLESLSWHSALFHGPGRFVCPFGHGEEEKRLAASFHLHLAFLQQQEGNGPIYLRR